MITLNNKSDFTYVYSGLFKSDGVWIHPQVTVETYEVIFMTEGCAYISEEGEEFEINKNDVLILEPNKVHFGFKPSKNPVSFYWMHFKLTNFEPLPKMISISEPFGLQTFFKQLLHTVNTPGYGENAGEALAWLVLEEIIFRSRNSGETGSATAVQIKEWIRINADKNINVKTIADVFGYHENYIGKIFKCMFGVGIKDYIVDIKTQNAKAQLATTMYTIKQIAHMCGFSDENHFVKFFKYHTEMTPTEYRNLYTNTHINKK